MPRRNVTIRNFVARSPLLRKGGAHVQSKTGERVQARIATTKLGRNWQDLIEEELDDRSDRPNQADYRSNR